MRTPLRQKASIPRAQVAISQTYPAPVGGWNARDALAAMRPTDAVDLENWFPGTSSVEIRGGYEDQFSGMDGNGKTLAVYNGLSGAGQMFCSTSSTIYDVTNDEEDVVNYLLLPGASGDYASTPDTAALDIVGDIEIISYVAMDDWTPSGIQNIVAKFVTTGSQRSYRLTVDTSGFLQMLVSADGISGLPASSTVIIPGVNGEGLWLRATLDVDDGAGNRVYNYYTSTDAPDTALGSITWTQLGITVTSAGATAIFAGTAPLEIGSISAGTAQRLAGKVYSAYVYDGIGGTLVASFNASDAGVGSSTVTSSLTSEVYTVHGNAEILGPLAVLAITNGKWQWVNFGDGSNNYLIMVNGTDKPRYYNGTNWVAVDASSSPALTGLTTTDIIGVFISKSRLYFIEKNSLSIWYLSAGAAGGALTEFDLSGVAKRGGYLVAGATWTVDGGDGPDDRIVFVTSEGETIVYAGTNPSSAAAWSLVGVYDLGRPLGRRCLQKYGGDLIVITQNGAFPLAAALQSASIDYKLALSFKIEKAFNEAARIYGSNFGWSAYVYPGRSALIVNVPIAEDGEHEQYVMNTITKAWCKFKEWDAEDFTIFDSNLYFCSGTEVKKAWSGQVDGDNDIIAYGKTAFSYFGKPGLMKDFVLYQPVLTVNGTLSFLTDIDVDFSENAMNGTATYSVTSGAQWDVDNWDAGFWAAGQEVVKQWTSPDEYPGYCASGKVKISTSSLTVQWMASNWVYQPGGPVG